ncbi:MFS transporter [Arcobacter sp. CECT 8983]|uniref:MFS transporter n=1 Tax=Arcobacter sp. CECT 8983 TaxID=2044508 RepID=UPI00100BE595|nr:MFS transporter [Arcobacter sp. CECT 8983]RXJ88768.1 MFS transporter [Arcobacter sp. CECT 8983]
MKKNELFIIIYTITVLLSVMYATQPIQPLLANEFDVSVVKASSFTAVIMLFLAISPIIYGYILESVKTKTVLTVASITLFMTNLALGFSNSYEIFLTIRTIEAMIVPAILTACMTILANDREKTKVNMSIYVAATVFGGLVGRVFSGFIATEFGWRVVFFSLSLALLFGLLLIRRLSFEGDTKLAKPKLADVANILKDKRFVVIYSLMFVIFFIFGGILNILPFRIKEQVPEITETQIGLLYLGYGVGIVVSLTIHKIIALFKTEVPTVLAGIGIFFLATVGFFSSNALFLFSLVFLFCLGMFIIHTVSTRIANSLKQNQKALTSGMYLSFYYLGGAIGSFAPSFVYANFGWNITMLVFISMLIGVFLFVFSNRDLFKNFN